MKAAILSAAEKPRLLPLRADDIPATLRNVDRWVGFKTRKKRGKWAKVPVTAAGGPASSTDPATWSTFDDAYDAYLEGRVDGIGFVLGDGWAGIDLDDCRDLETGELNDYATGIIAEADSYTEVSPTGTGTKIILLGSLPEGSKTKNKDGTAEFYSHGRYFCVTGHRINECGVEDRQEQLAALHAKYIDPPKPPKPAKPVREHEADGILRTVMRRIRPKEKENDGSNRLFALCCRAVEHDATDEVALANIRDYENEYPFPREYSDADVFARLRDAEEKVERGSARPGIKLGFDFPRVLEETVAALAAGDIYQSHGRLTRIDRNPEPCKFDLFDNGSPRLAFVPQGSMMEVLTGAADFQRYTKDEWSQCLPPEELRTAVFNRGRYPGVKQIHGVLSHPLLLPDGEIVFDHGYHPAGLFLNIDGSWPTRMSTDQAIAALLDVFSDYPLVGASQSACLAALFTLAARYLIKGNTPVFTVDGNKSRIGKGLITDEWTMIVEGRRASRYMITSEDELRKYLVSIAISGRTCVTFDNVKTRFGGAVLEAAMTAGTVSGRILGVSQDVDLPLKVTWLATMNGATYTPDMVGRLCPITMDTTDPHPEKRQDFKYPDLLGHVQQNRRSLFIAVLSVLSNYLRNGSTPRLASGLGGFNEWSNLIRGCLVWAGMPDPIETRESLCDLIEDDSGSVTKQLQLAWPFDKPLTVRDAVANIQAGEPERFLKISSILEGRDENRTPAEYLGNLLRRAYGEVIDGRCFDHDKTSRPKWFLRRAA